MQIVCFGMYNLFPEVAFREDVTGTAFEVMFETLSLFNRLERYVQFDLPRHELGRVRTFAVVMIQKPPTEVCGVAGVTLARTTQALKHVCVEHGLPSIAWNPNNEKSSFAKAMEDILRLEPSRARVPSEGWWRTAGNAPAWSLLAGQVHHFSATPPR